MFGNRYDGRRLKDIDPFMKMVPHIMTKRSDAQVFYKQEFDCEPLDRYIAEKRSEGIEMTYMHVVIASVIRLLALRPSLNRFVMNRQLYAHKGIWVSLAVKKALRDDVPETTIKLKFDGTETILDITERFNKEIHDTKNVQEFNSADELAATIMSLPNFLVKCFMGLVIFLDNHNMLPGLLIDASPFHTSFFLTNLKSIGLNYIYHHIYDFGTTSLFIAMGKEKSKWYPRRAAMSPAKKRLHSVLSWMNGSATGCILPTQ